MTYYQGRALKSEPGRPRARSGRLARVARMLAAIGIVTGLAHLPWGALRARHLRLTRIEVAGQRYLDAAGVARIAGLAPGQDLLALDCRRVRQALLLHPRIERAEVSRRWPRGVRVRIRERTPVMLVRRGLPWEVDSAGVLLPPLGAGVAADVPLLAGASFENVAPGTRLSVPAVRRGLAWVRAMSERDIQLAGAVSEVDVSDPDATGLLMMNGTRVLTPAWPPETRMLSALRVVLADLERRGTVAREVDVRFRDQVIVRPAEPLDAGEPVALEVRSGGGSARAPAEERSQ
jgi:cell division protein FtsQ